VASCGVRNRFGHPHVITQDTFAAQRVPLLRTDDGGALIWETDGDRVRFRRPSTTWATLTRDGPDG
jgi:competence protein ComEC